ncbi:DNA glycosylase [Cokeromyces recurvatus]|uniref:DNA glycosylase n=1 Tax=Cokeromyces recurvatus TaxID=90255 RepID=UPI0022201C09|nr:DNA glycosylase [Cokeromyces recurvatus]KAI7903476.1 DNA glycosylase [Cokeromyces recurvatus]
MKIIKSSSLLWKDLCIPPTELRLNTLRCGQSFRWKQMNDHWTPTTILFGNHDSHNKEQEQSTITELRDYFQLDKVSLKESIQFKGIRILRQDPWENLISFICSSNNNITRISQMIHKLCVQFGKKVAVFEDEAFYDFPSLQELLVPNLESILRDLGFGYRARYIAHTANKIKLDHPELGETWLGTLRNRPYLEAKKTLMEFQGVGPKVADCVCLMSLDHTESIPVDTHVWQIALKEYGFNKKSSTKTLNSQLYNEVGDHFRLLFGKYSGWAHSVLFTADLKTFETTTTKRKSTISVTEKEKEKVVIIKKRRVKSKDAVV